MRGNYDRPPEYEPLILDDRFLRFPVESLKSIIVGCQADYVEIQKVAEAANSRVAIKRAVRSPNEYSLLIEP